MTARPRVAWSGRVEAAAWVHERIVLYSRQVRGVVPAGFAAYAELGTPEAGGIAGADLAPLLEALRRHTTTPERCWFAVWEGRAEVRGGGAFVRLTSTRGGGAGASGPETLPGLAPAGVLDGPRARVGVLDYLLYTGPVEDARALRVDPWHATPDRWWADDRAWCVATDAEISRTFLGGPVALVAELVAGRVLDAREVEATTPLFRADGGLSADIVS